MIYEDTTGTLLSSDLFTHPGPADPITESDIVAPATMKPTTIVADALADVQER